MQLSVEKDSIAKLLRQGNTLKRKDKLEEAAAVYRRCLEIHPNSAWSHNNLGEVLYKLGDLNGAVCAYKKAIELNSNSAWFYNNLGESLYQQGKWDRAIKCFRNAINIKPDFDISYKNSGDCFYHKGWLEKAFQYYQKAIYLNQNSYDSLEKIGDLLAIKNQWDEAEKYYKISLLNPEFSLADRLIDLGKFMQKHSHFFKAVQLYCRGIQLNKNQKEKLPISIVNKGELSQIDLESNNQTIYTKIHPEITYSLAAAKTVHPTIHPLLSEQEKKSGNSSVVVIPGGSVWIDDPIGIAIASAKGNILIKHLFKDSHITTLPVKNLPPVLELDEPTAFLSIRKGQNYCHWMLDLLPKIDLLRKSGIDLKSIGKFIVSSPNERQFQKETLEALGIPLDRIVESLKYPYIKAKKLIVPSLIPKISSLLSMQKWACEFIKTEFINSELPQKLNISERIYISRKDASYRQVTNESEVE